MKTRSLVGDDQINLFLGMAMEATVEDLVRQKLMTPEAAISFLGESACMLLPQTSPFKAWVRRIFRAGEDEELCDVVIAKIAAGQ
jgi:hypothetical protein